LHADILGWRGSWNTTKLIGIKYIGSILDPSIDYASICIDRRRAGVPDTRRV
jgi:hypothetical protein